MNRLLTVVAVILLIFAINFKRASGQSSEWPAQPTFTVLHAFHGGADGQAPYANVILDNDGNIYGTTLLGGGSANCSGGCGTVYKVDSSGNESVLYGFKGSPGDGSYPYGGLLRDAKGNFYGTAWGGGLSSTECSSNQGCGTVWAMNAEGKEKTVYEFTGGLDGGNPHAALIVGPDGRLYSTTYWGGAHNNWGTVFAIDKNGVETVIHNFNGADNDGGNTQSGLILGKNGLMYGMTFAGDNPACVPNLPLGCGVIYSISDTGTETVLYVLDYDGGYWPGGNLIQDNQGNLYGTLQGGTDGQGTIFKLNTSNQFSVMYSFEGTPSSGDPWAGLVHDAAGNLYGTTVGGGGTDCPAPNGCGTVYVLTASGKFQVLHSFTGEDDGWAPNDQLAIDAAGNLYGVATNGGASNEGVVFKISR